MHLQCILLSTVAMVLLSCHLVSSTALNCPLCVITALGQELMGSDTRSVQNQVPVKKMIQASLAQVNQLERTLKLPNMSTILEEIRPYLRNYKQTVSDFANGVGPINDLYERYQVYTSDTPFEDLTMESFARACVSPNFYLLPLDRLYNVMKPKNGDENSIFNLFFADLQSEESNARLCDITISPQQQAHRLYSYIEMIMVKAHLMKLYAYHLLKKYDAKSYADEISEVKRNFTEKMIEIKNVAVVPMRNASKQFRPCDPERHEEGQTYTQLKWLFGAIVVNEIYLNSEGSCSNTCEDYQKTRIYRNLKERPQHNCQGYLYACSMAKFDHYCPATQLYRRYDGFKGRSRALASNVRASGHADCPGQPLPVVTESGAASNIVYSCDNCVCSCDDSWSRDTVRTFSTRRVTSNISNNRVITGLRLVEKQRVIHIQIQEGKLGPYGTVDKSTVRWKAVNEFDYTNSSIPSRYYFTVRKNFDKLYFRAVGGIPGWALTGIRFVTLTDGITLGITVTKFDYDTGKVQAGTNSGSKLPGHLWEELHLDAPDVPTLTNEQSIPNTDMRKYLRFRQADLAKDAAQTAIPFIDIQPVVSDPPAPLSGVVMFHKAVPGYGGFLGMKLIAYDYADVLGPTHV